MSTARSGREQVRRAVQVRAELGALLGDLPAVGEAEHLVPAAVGQDRMRPSDEAVQAAAPGNQLVAGTEIEVIGVAENDLRARLLEIAVTHRLDGALRPDRHEGGRLHDAVRSVNSPRRATPSVLWSVNPKPFPDTLLLELLREEVTCWRDLRRPLG